MEVNGHTDESGAEEANVLLSKRRADEVAKALVDRGISADILRTSGVAAAGDKCTIWTPIRTRNNLAL